MLPHFCNLQHFHYNNINTLLKTKLSTLVTGNPFICDCRLSWIYALRNETKDNTLKHSLEKVSCITEPAKVIRPNEEEDNEVGSGNVITEDYDYNGYNGYYDKGDEYNDKDKFKDSSSKAKKLVDIPVETLPCPVEVMQTIVENYGHPVQNEIRLKAFSKVGSIAPGFIVYFMLVLVF